MYPKGNLFVPASHGQLEAILKGPAGEIRGAALICHPHPLGGGTMHNKVVYRAAAGLLEAGLVTLRFNFRGVGSSTGEHDDGRGEMRDVKDALQYLTENYPDQPITLAGFSFGSRVGTEIALDDERITRLISLGTPVDKYDFSFLKDCRKPILFVHGDTDEFGSLKSLNSLVAQVAENTDTKLIVFENCGHFFDKHLEELKNTVREWTLERIKKDEEDGQRKRG
ncbi:MAG: alpha/beta fold hydrolase [Pyrinomonadaceae bacterium]